MELKKVKPNVTQDILTTFKTDLTNNILSSFIKGLKQEIRIELGQHQSVDIAIQDAIELTLNKQNNLRNDTKSILFNFESPNPNKTRTVFCQLCREINHEALFCMKASCVYCKSKEHVPYHCRTAKDVIVEKSIHLYCTHGNV